MNTGYNNDLHLKFVKVSRPLEIYSKLNMKV